jgi:hypothetical protein
MPGRGAPRSSLPSNPSDTMPSHPSPTARGRRLLAAGTTALAILALVPAQAVAGATIPHADGVDRPRVGAAIPATMLAGAGGASAAPTGRALPTRARRQDEVLRFVYVRDDRTTTMSGTIDDVARARRYRDRASRCSGSGTRAGSTSCATRTCCARSTRSGSR